MTSRITTCLGGLAVALALVNAPLSAQAPGALTGTYTGASQCAQGATNLKLTLLATPDGAVFGTVTVNLPGGTQKDGYTYSIQGTFSPATRKFVLTPVKWETAAPPNSAMFGLSGTFDSNELTGILSGGGCTSFNVERLRAASPPAETRPVEPAPPSPPRASAPAPTPAPAPQARGSRGQPPVANNKESPEDRLKRLRGPVLEWRADKQQPQTVLKADLKFLGDYGSLFAEAVCASNGVSVNFNLYDPDGEPGPQFEHREDPNTDSHAPVVDITVRIDGQSHAAKGFLELKGDNAIVNHVGLLFYHPDLPVMARGERRLEVRTGTPLDVLTQPLALRAAEAEIEEGLKTSAGQLSDLVNARSIQMDFPILDPRARATFELSPQTPLMHELASRCLGGNTSTGRAPAPDPAPRAPSGPLSR